MGRNERFYRILSYSCIFLLLFFVQQITLSDHVFHGFILNPIPAVLFALFMLESPLMSIGFAFAIGLLLDVFGGNSFFVYSAVMTLSALLCCLAARRFLRSNLSSVLLIALLGPMILDALRLLLLVFLEKASIRSLWVTTLPAALLSFLISVPAIIALFLIHRKLNLVFRR